jgi:predicted nucleotidyltransferase
MEITQQLISETKVRQSTVSSTDKCIINEFLEQLESKLNIKILYACETGSRAVGTSVEESDYDIKGFYIAKEAEYLKIIRSVNPNYISHHIKLQEKDKELEVDMELKDIQLYLREKMKNNSSRPDFWFKSKIIYKNLFTDEFLSQLTQHLVAPIFIFSPNDKSGLSTLQKLIRNNESILNKKLICLLISIIQYLHTELFKEENVFPLYNIFEEIEILKENKNKFSHYFSEGEIHLIMKNLELVEGLYNRKKQGRYSSTNSIPMNIIQFYDLVVDKFNPEKRRKDLKYDKNSIDPEWAQKVFEDLLYKYE